MYDLPKKEVDSFSSAFIRDFCLRSQATIGLKYATDILEPSRKFWIAWHVFLQIFI